MNKDKIIIEIAHRTGMTHKNSIKVVNCFLEVVKESLLNEENVSLNGFGSFNIQSCGQRRLYYPKMKKEILIEPRKRIRFKPSPKMKIK